MTADTITGVICMNKCCGYPGFSFMAGITIVSTGNMVSMLAFRNTAVMAGETAAFNLGMVNTD